MSVAEKAEKIFLDIYWKHRKGYSVEMHIEDMNILEKRVMELLVQAQKDSQEILSNYNACYDEYKKAQKKADVLEDSLKKIRQLVEGRPLIEFHIVRKNKKEANAMDAFILWVLALEKLAVAGQQVGEME